MGVKRSSCGENHRFQEHGIGAGLTRKVCVLCGALRIGEGRRSILVEDVWADKPVSLFVRAG